MTTRTPKANCLRCHQQLDAASHPGDDSMVPVPGDVTVCIHCGYIMAFADDLTFRELTEEELREVPLLEVSQIQRAIRQIREKVVKYFPGNLDS